MYPQESDTIPTVLVGESSLLELISTDAPLTEVLNKICAALDVQLGNVVSVVLYADEDEHFTHTIAKSAAQFGLFIFSRSAILSVSEDLLGTLEVYCCFQASPTPSESNLIEQAAHLAALAIQCHNHQQSSGSVPFDRKGAERRATRERPLFKN
jgi:GAF domain-containing protein